jgi:hypothetical protein
LGGSEPYRLFSPESSERREIFMLSLYRHVSINTQLSAESERLSWTPNKEDFYAIGYWAMLTSLQIRCLAETLPGVGMCRV